MAVAAAALCPPKQKTIVDFKAGHLLGGLPCRVPVLNNEGVQ